MINSFTTATKRRGNTNVRIGVTVFAFLIFAAGAAVVFFIYDNEEPDLTNVFPAESIAFLETGDAGQLVDLIAANAGTEKKDRLNGLNGVSIAVAVKSFESSKEDITSDAAVLSFGPKFAAALDPGGWGWGTQGFVDEKLNDFVNGVYGEGVERSEKSGKISKIYVWKAADGRQLFAAINGSRVIFGNDADFVERCLLAATGKAPSLAEDQRLKSFRADNRDAVILGYFPQKAVSDLSEIAGVMAAVSGSDDPNVRSFIAGIVPLLIKNSVRHAFWKATVENGRFKDSVELDIGKENGDVLSETIKPERFENEELFAFVPSNQVSVSRYSVKDLRIAYRSLAIVAARNSDASPFAALSTALLSSYGIADAESFLGATNGAVLTIRTRERTGEAAIVAKLRDKNSARNSLNPDVKVDDGELVRDQESEPESVDGNFKASFLGNLIVVGNKRVVESCLEAGGRSGKSDAFSSLIASDSAVATISEEGVDYSNLLKMFSEQRNQTEKGETYLVETDFRKNLLVRTYRSRFGLFGSFIANSTD